MTILHHAIVSDHAVVAAHDARDVLGECDHVNGVIDGDAVALSLLGARVQYLLVG